MVTNGGLDGVSWKNFKPGLSHSHVTSSIHGMRQMAVGEGFVAMPWEGPLFRYEVHDGMLVPTRMEIGWWVDGKLDICFKGNNTKHAC